jgi:hypothetical protein
MLRMEWVEMPKTFLTQRTIKEDASDKDILK